VTYVPHHDSVTAFNTHEPLLYRTLRIPADAPAGEVRVRIPAASQAYVFSTSVSRYVLAAPEGLMVGPGMLLRGKPLRLGLAGGAGDLWHFLVPAGTRSFRLASSVPEELMVLDPAGKPASLQRKAQGVIEVAVPVEHGGKLWSLKARSLADVVLIDIPPVFAYVDPGRHFLPQGAVPVSAPVAVPAWSVPAQPRD
jgi:hypothetical protein